MIILKTITPTVIDETEQALQAFILHRWRNRYQNGIGRFKLPRVEKWLSLLGLIFAGGVWLIYTVMIFLDKVFLDGDNKFDYEFWGLLTFFTIVFGFFFYYDQKIIDTIKTFNEKSFAISSRRYSHKIFKIARQQNQPFTAIYEFDGNQIHYFRQIGEQKIHQWTRNIEPYYKIGENFVLFFNKPTAYSPKIFMFIDEEYKQNLVNYLNQFSHLMP